MTIWQQCLAWFKKECPACHGSGITVCNCDEHYEIVCPECMGKGVIDECVSASNIIEIPCDHPGCHDGWVSCSQCLGTGKTSANEPCPHCHGRGQVECPLCHGIGRIKRQHQEQWIAHRQCPTCGGRGVIACPYCHGTKNRVCPVCQGQGEVWNKGRLAFAGVILLFLTIMPTIAIPLLGFALAGLVLYVACQYFPPQTEGEASSEEGPKDGLSPTDPEDI